MNGRNFAKFIAAILICQLAGIVGSIFTRMSVSTWYVALKKPAFCPPNWLFSPVWIMLFILMGISLYLVWRGGVEIYAEKSALWLFAIQLLLNVFWPMLFFGLRAPFYALVEIVVLWLAILFTAIAFFKVSKAAGYLLLPYLSWVTFAAVLNFSIYMLNP